MTYEPIYERFATVGSDGVRREAEFVRAGFLAQGDRPELFFFRVNGEETMVGISGGSLARFRRGRPRLTRERKRVRAVLAARRNRTRAVLAACSKINVAGRWLKRQMEAGWPLDSRSLYIQDDELANLAIQLDFTQRGSDETL